MAKTEAPQLRDTLSLKQQKQAWCLLDAFNATFTTLSGQTSVVHHTIQMNPGEVVRETIRLLL